MISSASTVSASPAQVIVHPLRVALAAVGAADEREAVAGLELGDVVVELADPQLRARAGPAGSRPGARRGRPRRARSRAVSACSSALPWEKFSRATSIPASTIRTSTSGSREAGPIVATIFVRRIIATHGTHPRPWTICPRCRSRPKPSWRACAARASVVADVLRELRRRVQPGVTTSELDRVAGRVFARHGARSAPKLVYGAPSEVFISVNDAAVHGVPGPRRLRRGDVVKLDVTAELDGFFADACVTVVCGPASPAARRLVSAAQAALADGLSAAVAGAPVRAISEAVAERRVCARRLGARPGSAATASAAPSTRSRRSPTRPTSPTTPCSTPAWSSRSSRSSARAARRSSRAATAGRSRRPTARSPPTPSTRSSSPTAGRWS